MDEYPTWVGFVFIFNLIVGTGALTLPSAFSKTGWVLGIVLIIFLAFTSYITVTYVIESLSCSNAILKWKRLQYLKRDRVVRTSQTQSDDSDDSDVNEERSLINQNAPPNDAIENTPLCIQRDQFYSLNEKVELGEMSNLFFNQIGGMAFYLCIAIYLYGDLSIYSAAVSTTIRDVMCEKNATSDSAFNNTLITDPCWSNHSLSRFDVYRLCLITFTMLLSPWVFFNVSKTKHLQFLTTVFRWLAFTVMISIAIYKILKPDSNNPDWIKPDPPKANFQQIPYLIGACIYSFMCQHSLPSLLVPIKEKLKIYKIVSLDYLLIVVLYLILALTGIFAFSDIRDLYTLNFIPQASQQSIVLKTIEYFLALFPVFTLSTSFPIIAITLRNNLQTLFLDKNQLHSYNYFVRFMIFPLMAVIPPFLITFNTENVSSLVSFTGCYAGAVIQYLIPIALVYYSRKMCANLLGRGLTNEFASPFKSNNWLVMIFSWTCISLIIVSINMF
ncbi:unnamed protein product [Diamesa tonsa]